MTEENNKNISYAPVPEKKPPYLLIIIIVVLLGGLGVLSTQYFRIKKDSELKERIIEEEKDDLTQQLNNMYMEYDSLKTENDSMNLKLEAEQAKIQRLLGISASNAQKIRLYKKELETLRDIMKSYIVQIDSLNQRNQLLMAENREVRTRLFEVETSKEQLETEREELTTKVAQASMLQAKDIQAIPLNRRSRDTYRTKRVAKIRTCFTIRENPIIPAGVKTIYIRINRPDDVVLTNDANNLFEYNDEMIVFSASRDLEYENQDIEMCIYWDRPELEEGITMVSEDLIDGTYSVDIFHEGNIIGTTTFTLR